MSTHIFILYVRLALLQVFMPNAEITCRHGGSASARVAPATREVFALGYSTDHETLLVV